MEDKPIGHEESLNLIGSMLYKAKKSHFDTGIIPILWGSVIAFCSLFTAAQIKGWVDLPFSIWYLAFVAVIPSIYFNIKQKKRANAVHYDDKLTDSLWLIFGLSIFMLFIILNILGNSGDVKNLSKYSSSFFLLLYGFPTLITGIGKNILLMTIGGIVCWIGAIVSLYTPTEIDMLLIAVSTIISWLIPGLILRLRNNNV